MPVNLSVKNVSDDLAELLRRRAAANHRSLQRELLSILEAAVGTAPSVSASQVRRDALTVEELVTISGKLFPKGTASSVAFIRQMRDSR